MVVAGAHVDRCAAGRLDQPGIAELVVATAHGDAADDAAAGGVDDLVGIGADEVDRLVAAQVEAGGIRRRDVLRAVAVTLDQPAIDDQRRA